MIRPAVGFGRIGWIALAILGAMLTAVAMGWDPYMQMLRAWAALLGGGSVTTFAVVVAVYPRHTIMFPQITFVTALVATVAMWIQPRAVPAWRLAALWAAAPCLAQAHWLAHTATLRPLVAWADICRGATCYNWLDDALIALFSTLVLWWALRSAAVAIVSMSLAAMVIGALYVSAASGWSPPTGLKLGVLWQLGVGATMVAVAIAERRSAPKGGGPWCGACGYDLRSLAATRCPECGAEK